MVESKESISEDQTIQKLTSHKMYANSKQAKDEINTQKQKQQQSRPDDLKENTKSNKCALNTKKQEDSKHGCNVEYVNRRSRHSSNCCGRNSLLRQKSLERRAFPRRQQTVKSLKNHISKASAMYSEFLVHYPNLKMILYLCQDILLLKILNRIRGMRNYITIKKRANYERMSRAKDKQKMERMESVESIAEFSLKRMFEEENKDANSCLIDVEMVESGNGKTLSVHKLMHYIQDVEQANVVPQNTDDAESNISKAKCKCYRNHARGEATSKKVRRMLENYERMITTGDVKKDVDIADSAKCVKINVTALDEQDSENASKQEEKALICFNDTYECECKSKNSKSLTTCHLKQIIPKNNNDEYDVTLETTVESACTIIKRESAAKDTNHILDQIVCDALRSIRECHKKEITCDSNDEQNQADDEQSSDSESECKKIDSHFTTICRRPSSKSENVKYLLLFGKSKSQLKKRDVGGHLSKEQLFLARKGLMGKQEPEKLHMERGIKHYRTLQ